VNLEPSSVEDAAAPLHDQFVPARGQLNDDRIVALVFDPERAPADAYLNVGFGHMHHHLAALGTRVNRDPRQDRQPQSRPGPVPQNHAADSCRARYAERH
jgi:hypothetical protein